MMGEDQPTAPDQEAEVHKSNVTEDYIEKI